MTGDIVRKVGSKIFSELKKLLGLALYFWVLFTLFAFHKAILNHDQNIILPLGIALINSKLMAKVVYVGEHTRLSRRFENRPLIYTILFKSLIFAIVLFLFRVAEEILIGVWEGKSFFDALAHDHPAVSEGGAQIAIAMVCIIMFVALIPFFAYREIEDALGAKLIRDLLFKKSLADFKNSLNRSVNQSEISETFCHSGEMNHDAAHENWYYELSGEINGPYTQEEFEVLLSEGRISMTTMVWNERFGNSWRQLHSLGS
jgi:hypothetical protein